VGLKRCVLRVTYVLCRLSTNTTPGTECHWLAKYKCASELPKHRCRKPNLMIVIGMPASTMHIVLSLYVSEWTQCIVVLMSDTSFLCFVSLFYCFCVFYHVNAADKHVTETFLHLKAVTISCFVCILFMLL